MALFVHFSMINSSEESSSDTSFPAFACYAETLSMCTASRATRGTGAPRVSYPLFLYRFEFEANLCCLLISCSQGQTAKYCSTGRKNIVQIIHHFEGKFVNVSSKNWPSELCLISARHYLQLRRVSSQDPRTLSHISRIVSLANDCCVYPGSPRRLYFSLNIDWSLLWP